ncbi:MAG: zinc-dependent metalloprotease [Geodermatophilaceae bacterium]|nr:zinc-dependent metalloprotease [Geodermatophilaceae bacterium]
MTDHPFGFGPGADGSGSGDDPDRSGSGREPARGGGGFGIPEDIASKVPLFAELQKLLSWQGGPVNWDLARQTATSQVAGGHVPVSAAERRAVEEAVRLADLWLDPVTTLPSGVTQVEAWSRVEWIEKTLPVWSQLCDPIASRVVTAMGQALPEQAQQMAGPMMGLLGQFGGMMFGAQVGQGMSSLAGEVLSSTDVGLPLAPPGTAVLLPQNVAAFGSGLDRPDDEVRLFLALREAAAQRLFRHVPWLRQRLLDTVDAYARGINVDNDAINEAMMQIDPGNPESIQQVLGGGMFQPQDTPEQKLALARLETLLALVEGWVDHVVAVATEGRLPGAVALRETIRRRRASGGPAEQTFATLVGLELRPRRLREASTLWRLLAEQRDSAGRDALWAQVDLLPTSEDLDDPQAFVDRDDSTGPSMADLT